MNKVLAVLIMVGGIALAIITKDPLAGRDPNLTMLMLVAVSSALTVWVWNK